MKNIRQKALLIINNVFYKGAFLNEELSILEKSNLDSRDYNLIVNISLGVVKNKMLLEEIIKKYSKIKLKKIHKVILSILEMGVYQIFFTDKIPDYSIINESVNLAKIYGNKGSAGFVNGVLRSILRDKEILEKTEYGLSNLKKENYVEYLSKYYSHEEFYIKLILDEKGEKFTEDNLRANNEEAPFTVRVNTNKITVDKLISELENKGYRSRRTKISKFAVNILNPAGIFNTKYFKDGYFYVQDEASILVAELSEISCGSNILDLCAAPGGKSINFSLLNKENKITACDISNKKLKKIAENKTRLSLNNIELLKNDATIYNAEFKDKFDLVLIDAPCSGLGLYRRKPEIKYNKNLEDIKSLSKIQKNILENASSYVKKDGLLIYSTCTITKMENEDIISSFLEKHKNFEIVESLDKETLKLYPNENNTDGFSISRLRRVK